MTLVQHREHRATTTKFVAILLFALAASGCGAHWTADWGGGHHRSCGPSSNVHVEGDGTTAAIMLGVLGIAWGIEELVEAIGGH